MFVFDFVYENQCKVHQPFPDHQKVESYEQSENATNICHKRIERKGFYFLPNKNIVARKYWPQLSLIVDIAYIGFFCSLKRERSYGRQYIAIVTTLYSIKEQGIRHFVFSKSSSLPKVMIQKQLSLYSFSSVLLSQRGRPFMSTLLHGGLQPVVFITLLSTQCPKLQSEESSHGLLGRFSFSCLRTCSKI